MGSQQFPTKWCLTTKARFYPSPPSFYPHFSIYLPHFPQIPNEISDFILVFMYFDDKQKSMEMYEKMGYFSGILLQENREKVGRFVF